jgi:hypothetical protein
MQNDSVWGAPQGNFYLLQGNAVPYSPKPTVINIVTDQINEPIVVSIFQAGPAAVGVDPRNNSTNVTIVPASANSSFSVQLGRGANLIQASALNDPSDVGYLIVNATTIWGLWEAYARVLYNGANSIIDEQNQAISSPLATRLIEPFISFQDMLPDIQSLQIMATRFVARGFVSSPGTVAGVNDLLQALTLSTPVYHPMDKDTYDLYPALDPWTKCASQYGGQEAHVWMPNVGVMGWLAFLGFINNQPDLYDVLKVNEYQVAFDYQGIQQSHMFNFDLFGTNFLTTLARSQCFKSIQVSMTMTSRLVLALCAASYTFDLFITNLTPIGRDRVSFDLGIPFDSGLNFDSDPVDPFSDGWVGLSLSGRFEQDANKPHTLDTFVMPSASYTGAPCGYPSYYTQMLANNKYDVWINYEEDVTSGGLVYTWVLFTLQSPDLTLWDISVDTSGQIVATAGSSRNPDNFMVTEPNLTQVGFEIDNNGQIQTVSPPPAGATQNNAIVLIDDVDYTFWLLTVDNNGEIVTVQQ